MMKIQQSDVIMVVGERGISVVRSGNGFTLVVPFKLRPELPRRNLIWENCQSLTVIADRVQRP